MKAPSTGLPAAIENLRQRVNRWRENRKKHGPMPEKLWLEAVRLAQEYGVYAISRPVGLEYATLKRRSQETPVSDEPCPPTFVEVAVRPPSRHEQCMVEMERPDGGKMRVRLSGQADLVALSDSFWRCAR